MNKLVRKLACVIAGIAALKATFDAVAVYHISLVLQASPAAAVFETGCAAVLSFITTAFGLCVVCIVLGAFVIAGRSIVRSEQLSVANSSDKTKLQEPVLPCDTIKALLESGWSISNCGQGFIEIYMRGSRGQVPLPETAVEEFNSAGWTVTYHGAQFVPPPWWVSNDPIELDGVYRIQPQRNGKTGN